MPLKRMFGDRNVHKTFSALNLTIICIKPFTSNNTTFSSILLKCWMKHYFSIKHCLLNTSSLFRTAFKTWLNTDWLTQQAFISDIPSSQMHSSPTTDNSVSSFNFYVIFVLSTGNKVLANSLLYQGCLIHIYLQDVPHFDSLTLSNTFLCNFLLVFYFGWQLFHSCFLLFISTRQVIGMICICIFISNVF